MENYLKKIKEKLEKEIKFEKLVIIPTSTKDISFFLRINITYN